MPNFYRMVIYGSPFFPICQMEINVCPLEYIIQKIFAKKYFG